MKRTNQKSSSPSHNNPFICPTYVERNPRNVTCTDILLKKKSEDQTAETIGWETGAVWQTFVSGSANSASSKLKAEKTEDFLYHRNVQNVSQTTRGDISEGTSFYILHFMEIVIGIFHWLDPSGRTMALGSTQPQTEMSTRFRIEQP